MADWREISGDQNLWLSQKVLEQQGEIKNLKRERDEALAEVEQLRGELEDAERVRSEVLATLWDDGVDREGVPTLEIHLIFDRADKRLDQRMHPEPSALPDTRED